MTADGFGVGCVYAVNPLQITGGVPATETGSAMIFRAGKRHRGPARIR
jgi:hypothetical protein